MKHMKKILILVITTFFVIAGFMGTSKAKAVEVFPTISSVKVGHSPLVVGDTETFTVTSAKY